MSQKITIDPITRLEGHGKIEIFLNESGDVDRAFLQIPELRGFEKFCVGRPAEEMARITPRICGVCPTAHHMASTKALDDLYKVSPTPAAKAIRELFYNMFMFEDHLLHFFYLGGPDFVVGPEAPKAERNILGVIGKVGLEVASQLITMRKSVRDLMSEMAGKVIHPVFGLPGGVSKRVTEEQREKIKKVSHQALDFAEFTLKVFDNVVLKNPKYVELVTGDTYKLKTYYMGMVDKTDRVNFYDGDIKIIDPSGKEFGRFKGIGYLDWIGEHVEPWSFIKFPYLKKLGWRGFEDGDNTCLYRVAPMARLNAAIGMATPKAQEAYEWFYQILGEKPVHYTLAYHWARVIEVMQAAEEMVRLSNIPELTDQDIRNIPTETPKEGVGIVEAPRGTLIHHYKSDENGIITEANLIVATVSNSAAISLNIEKAAKNLIKNGNVNDGLLNMVEMAFRPYDPCFGCATHSLPGEMPLTIYLRDPSGNLIREIKRGS
ncbi:MAG: Ni/Fe hydrogenase subunit alpha [Syntrophorhabdaceae bacterium]|nr:Ni/Fe hydrogenase subunit alpha [Syntrophorhabdaceae bacterium]